MGYIVLKTNHELRIVPEAQYSDMHRERDLQNLIYSNPQIVGALLGEEDSECDIRALKKELVLPSGGRLDLLLITSTGRLILVEFKRNRGYRDAIAQLLDYASDIQSMGFEELMRLLGWEHRTPEEFFRELFGVGDEESINSFSLNLQKSLETPQEITMLLVSYSAGEDTKRIVSWLRRTGIDINIVEFDYFTDEHLEIIVPRLVMADSSEPTQRQRTLSEAEKVYLAFFSDVLSRFKEKKPGVTERRARADRWLEIPLGHTGIHLEWKIWGGPGNKKVRVALVIDTQHPKANRIKELLIQRKEIIRENLTKRLPHETINWDTNSNVRALNLIYVDKDAGELSDLLNDEIKKWAVATMIAFYDVLKREIDNMMKRNGVSD